MKTLCKSCLKYGHGESVIMCNNCMGGYLDLRDKFTKEQYVEYRIWKRNNNVPNNKSVKEYLKLTK